MQLCFRVIAALGKDKKNWVGVPLQNRQVLNVRANHRDPCVRRGGQQPAWRLASL